LLVNSCQSETYKGTPITVASARTPEQLVLGQITVQALRAAGYTVVDKTGLGDLRAVRTAIETGRADIYWDYTGDTWTNHLGHDIPISDPQEIHRRVRAQDAHNGITWLSPTPCRHVMGLVMRREMADQHQLAEIADLVRYINRYDPYLPMCSPEDVYGRLDGVRGLMRRYNLRLDTSRVLFKPFSEGYEALARGECDVAMGYSTDSALAAYDLIMLQDKLDLFQASHLSVAVRTPLMREYPNLEGTLAQVSNQLTEETVRGLGQQVAIQGESPEIVARQFLTHHGLTRRKRLSDR
jgi:osmoprotectant transport system substrate-binding protein